MPYSAVFSPVIATVLLGLLQVGLVAPLDAAEWETRIVGGTNATGNVCPHAVAIRLVGRDFLCNGALISNQDVLTAAQCVYNGAVLRNASEFLVVLGSVASSNSSGGTLRSVTAVWPHSLYVPNLPLNDVAVLRLNGTVQTSASLAPVQLSAANPVVNQTCRLCGWGANSTAGRPLATLQRLDLKVQPNNNTYCTRANGNVALRTDQICAGDLAAGRGACIGDQGAPLVCEARLQGVLTVVGGCGGLNETSIFINTVVHRDWINNRTQTQAPGGGGTPSKPGGGGGGGGGASQAAMQIWVVMMPILILLALK